MLPKPSDYNTHPIHRMLDEGLRNFKVQVEQSARRKAERISRRIQLLEDELESANELLETQHCQYLNAYQSLTEKPDQAIKDLVKESKHAYDCTSELISSLRRVLRKEVESFRGAKQFEETVLKLNQELDKLELQAAVVKSSMQSTEKEALCAI